MSENVDPMAFETALTEAETACFAFLNEVLGLKQGETSFISVRGRGALDCMVFDVGFMQTGDVATFKARNYHWRASAEFYARDRRALQVTIMRLLGGFPVAAQYEREHPLLKDSCVVHFRIAPETNAISTISTQEVETAAGAKKVPAFTCTVQFDVVFNAGSRAMRD